VWPPARAPPLCRFCYYWEEEPCPPPPPGHFSPAVTPLRACPGAESRCPTNGPFCKHFPCFVCVPPLFQLSRWPIPLPMCAYRFNFRPPCVRMGRPRKGGKDMRVVRNLSWCSSSSMCLWHGRDNEFHRLSALSRRVHGPQNRKAQSFFFNAGRRWLIRYLEADGVIAPPRPPESLKREAPQPGGCHRTENLQHGPSALPSFVPKLPPGLPTRKAPSLPPMGLNHLLPLALTTWG